MQTHLCLATLKRDRAEVRRAANKHHIEETSHVRASKHEDPGDSRRVRLNLT